MEILINIATTSNVAAIIKCVCEAKPKGIYGEQLNCDKGICTLFSYTKTYYILAESKLIFHKLIFNNIVL